MKAFLISFLKQYGSAYFRLSLYILIVEITQSVSILQALTPAQRIVLKTSLIAKYILLANVIMPGLIVFRAFVDTSMTTATNNPPNPPMPASGSPFNAANQNPPAP